MSVLEFRDKPEGVFFPFDVAVTGVSAASLVGGAVLLGGYSFIESTGAAPAQLDLIDGGSNGGILLVTISLGAGVSTTKITLGRGLAVSSGLFLKVNLGSVRGSLWLADQ